VALFYHDNVARDRAIALTDHLSRRFMAEVDFRFSWWCLQHLGDPSVAETAALSALEADVLVFAAPALAEPGEGVRAWFERWAPQRNEAMGVLVPLLYPATVEALSDSVWMVEIEELAQQTGLDCLLPSELQHSPLFSESARRLQHQSKHLGWVMDGILSQPGHLPPPPHWGLNE
jgi:hypothetical protein